VVFADLSEVQTPAIFVIGPTASGKSALAHSLMEEFPALRLVNLDAFQFYRGVTAGTAKPTEQERALYDYSLIDFLDPPARMDAQVYAGLAAKTCAAIAGKGFVPLCVGGSGLYLRALLHGLDDLPAASADLRKAIREEAARSGWPFLHSKLAAVDAVRAAELHVNDSSRIERALEIHSLTGKPMSALRARTLPLMLQPALLNACIVRVEPDRTWLKERIESRSQMLVGSNWRDEVTGLRSQYGESLRSFQSMQAIGYSRVLDAVEGLRPWDEKSIAAEIVTLTWQYARRQLTWNSKETAHAKWDPAQSDTRIVREVVGAFLKTILPNKEPSV
jgi:tRNA dimethylallyltransferase